MNHADDLARLTELKRRLLRRAAREPRAASRLKPRHGATQAAVIKILAETAPEPMPIKAIHAAVEHLQGERVSRGTIEGCLSEGVRRARPRFVRVKPGWYRLAAAE